jgi:uncharacterized protein
MFNFFIDTYIGNTYHSLSDLFDEQESDYYPTGTCLPFQKKLFLTVNGKILPCERIGQKRPLGFIENGRVAIDFNDISKIYADCYLKILKDCKKCFTWNNCGQCMFLIKEKNNTISCNVRCSNKNAKSYLSRNMTTAEKHPFLHTKLITELIITE